MWWLSIACLLSFASQFKLLLSGCSDESSQRTVIEGSIYACPGTIASGGTRGSDAAALCSDTAHVCYSAQEVSDLGLTTDMCRSIAVTDTEFFGTQETSWGDWQCESVYTNPNGITNDIWGCASTASGIDHTCLTLTSAIGNRNWNYWQAGTDEAGNAFTSVTEADTYILTDSAGGGVLCCAGADTATCDSANCAGCETQLVCETFMCSWDGSSCSDSTTTTTTTTTSTTSTSSTTSSSSSDSSDSSSSSSSDNSSSDATTARSPWLAAHLAMAGKRDTAGHQVWSAQSVNDNEDDVDITVTAQTEDIKWSIAQTTMINLWGMLGVCLLGNACICWIINANKKKGISFLPRDERETIV